MKKSIHYHNVADMMELANEKNFESVSQVKESARKIGEYLVAAGACDETAVLTGLERQENLRSKGYDPFIGMLLLDEGVITKKDLSQALKLQDIDRLANSAIFHPLSRNVIADIHSKSERFSYSPNDVIFKQNESSKYVYVILR